MGFIGSTLGLSSGDNGSAGLNYSADKANIIPGVSQAMTNQAYAQTQQGLGWQQDLINNLQAQNGIGNQSNVFGQQQALANQLQGVANGTGPNPALQQLQNTTGQNVANQASLMAGQRGSGANIGLMARQAAMQGANTQQQALGQGAALSAQQQLSGMGALQQQQSLMGNMANQQAANQIGATNAYSNATQGQQANLLGGLGQYNNANVSMQSNVNSANAGIANTAAQGQQALLGGTMNAIGNGAGMMMKGMAAAKGGMVVKKKFADGGMDLGPSANNFSLSGPGRSESSNYSLLSDSVPSNNAPSLGNYASQIPNAEPMPQSMIGQSLFNAGNTSPNQSNAPMPGNFYGANPGAAAIAQGTASMLTMGQSNQGGNSSSGGGGGMSSMMQMAPMAASMAAAKGGAVIGEKLAAKRKEVPGKAKVKGDSYSNDTVNAVLSPGEIIIPRHITQAANAPQNAARFVAAILAKQGMKSKGVSR